MQFRAQQDVIRRVLAHRRAGTTQLAAEVYRCPASDYASAAELDRERRDLFRDGVVVAGLTADAPAPNDYFAIDVGGLPILVMRDAGGGLHAFANACRHRGGRLADGRGQLPGGVIRCPVHAWTYAADGRLLRQPNSAGGFDDLDKQRLGLPPLPIAEHGGVIAIRPGGGAAIDMESVLEGMADDLAHFNLSSVHHFDTQVRTWRCNWKLVFGTFLESYHVFSLHRDSVDAHYLSHPMVFDGYERGLRFPVMRRSIAELEGIPESEWNLLPHATVQYWIAPNALLAYTLDHWVVWRVTPVAVDQTVTTVSLYTDEPVTSDGGRHHFERMLDVHLTVAGTEDFPNQERVQEALGAGALPELVFGRNEIALIHFHRTLRALLAEAT